ncbi:MAG: phage holin family protein [Ilumatobacter sp.]|uniref:phage holin family protein n=1 Tax=Ilumatobacter sp. TaxID=1967498 RepID=UPI003919CB5B
MSAKREEASLGEVIEFVKTYAKQETLDPLKGAGRWLAFGTAAAFALGLGLMLLLLGALRAVQTEWDRSATGSLSWLAYLIVLVITLVLLAFTVLRIKKSTLNNEPK